MSTARWGPKTKNRYIKEVTCQVLFVLVFGLQLEVLEGWGHSCLQGLLLAVLGRLHKMPKDHTQICQVQAKWPPHCAMGLDPKMSHSAL